MINTLDLTVDMLFFELKFNPWTVRNVLEQFVDRYSYVDQVFSPEDPGIVSGGFHFRMIWASEIILVEGNSCYECPGLDRKCFSYMTCEQLTNWILCAGLYLHKTRDVEFLNKHHELFLQCLESLLNRDHPDASQRNGLMSLKARALKEVGRLPRMIHWTIRWGRLAAMFIWLVNVGHHIWHWNNFWGNWTKSRLRPAHALARFVAPSRLRLLTMNLLVLFQQSWRTIIKVPLSLQQKHLSILGNGAKDAVDEEGPFGGYISMLKRHCRTSLILRCAYMMMEDGNFSSADNSWMSKISISQFVVREILGISYQERSERMQHMYLGRSKALSFMHAPTSLVLVSPLVASIIHELSLTSYGWIRMQ